MLRISFVSVALALTLSVCQAEHLSSQRQCISLVLDAPTGWEGPSYSAPPSYETWSFSRGAESDAVYIEVRIDPARHSELDWNAATEKQIRETFSDFSNPVVERVAKVAISGIPVLVWAAHNVDGELLIAKLRRKGCDLNCSVRANNRAKLQRYQRTFLRLLKSIRIVSEEPASSPKAAITPTR